MPELRQPTQPMEVGLEQVPYFYDQEPDDLAAVELVRKTFGRYESLRITHERRWDAAARLYHGTLDERTWPGTDVKRASLPVPIVYDQVEAAYPIITDALFTYWPTFFDVTPLPGTAPAEAAQVRDVLGAYLETPFDETGLTPVTHMKMAVKQSEKFGDGCVELSWDMALKRPVVEWVNTKDVYVEPTTPGPCAAWSPAVILRKLMTVQELAGLRGTTGVKIPGDEILNGLAKMRSITLGDVSRQREALARKEIYYVGDLRTDPQHQLVEVLQYWTKDRLIWILGRVITAINQPNPYGLIPVFRCPYTVIEGRPYSMSLAEVLDGEQKYAQGIRNARLDNLSLALNPPRTRALGTPTAPSATAWRPGLEDRVNDPKQVEVAKIENVTSDAYTEEQVIHQSAAKRTGINEFVQSGVPTPSNANRSATGVATQQRAVSTRLSIPVGNAEDYMIVPLLYAMQKLIEKFAPEQIQAVDKNGGTITAPKTVFAKGMRFRMEAASRMRNQEKLAMFLIPVSQILFNEAVLSEANKQGKTLDFAEWDRFFQDATGTAHGYEFFRDVTPQEQQQMNQPDPKTQMEMMKAQMEAQTRMAMGKMKADTETQKAKLDFTAKTHATGEKSASEVLKLLQKDREGVWKTINDATANQSSETSDSGT